MLYLKLSFGKELQQMTSGNKTLYIKQINTRKDKYSNERSAGPARLTFYGVAVCAGFLQTSWY